MAQQSIRYSDSMADLEVVEAYTQKADGTRIPVEASAIFTQLPQGAPNVPSFNDQKQKVIVFPNVAAGDLVVYTTRQHMKHPFFPGYFTVNDAFPRTLSIDEFQGSLVVPKSMPLEIEAHGMTFAKEEKDSSVVYHWTYAAPDALTEDNAQVSQYDLNPRYFVSSFKDYDEFARAYEFTGGAADRGHAEDPGAGGRDHGRDQRPPAAGSEDLRMGERAYPLRLGSARKGRRSCRTRPRRCSSTATAIARTIR